MVRTNAVWHSNLVPKQKKVGGSTGWENLLHTVIKYPWLKVTLEIHNRFSQNADERFLMRDLSGQFELRVAVHML
jgi:hypothetical protein